MKVFSGPNCYSGSGRVFLVTFTPLKYLFVYEVDIHVRRRPNDITWLDQLTTCFPGFLFVFWGHRRTARAGTTTSKLLISGPAH